jgi:hypothetical protein
MGHIGTYFANSLWKMGVVAVALTMTVVMEVTIAFDGYN